MDAKTGLEKMVPRTRWAFGLGLGIALGVLAATIALGVLFVRGQVRDQMARRDAEALHATTLMEQLDDALPASLEIRSDEQIGFDSAVRASRLKGVVGIRFYGVDGAFTDAVPATIQPRPLTSEALACVRSLRPHSRFHRAMPLSDVFIFLPQFAAGQIAREPILEVTVPLHRRNAELFAGAAQFVVEGSSMAAEYARLDRRLFELAAGTFAIAGVLMVAMLWPVFRQMEKLNLDLAVRGERLQRANEELALAARTSAIGAVSAHLMHGLKNPLASLEQFVASRNGRESGPGDDDWQDALTAAHRMQALVGQTLDVLGDIGGAPAYTVPVAELLDEIRRRVAAAAARRKVRLVVENRAAGELAGRTANLAGLILVNLLENAIEASPADGAVELSASTAGGRLRFSVRDGGPGFPEHLRGPLFLPCKSTREGGCGMGLAISKLIADHLGARLALEESTSRGSLFVLELPPAA